ncbi:hypothetical protein T12_1097 [Trichinella patagoniensis]|uniref:Uncharacterized protein n=1 Tax=Trichinella patagoniensis TaxID=990121 RepID=A0A0V1ACF3_9BILA|nr:hypothetical protein T12_1097 [Trichinella patagoniensis]
MLRIIFMSFINPPCYVRKVTDPVGLTPPAPMVPNGRGRRKNNTRAPLARSLFRRLATPIRGQRDPLRRPRMTVARQTMVVYAIAPVAGHKVPEEAARWTSTPNDHREMKGAESITA